VLLEEVGRPRIVTDVASDQVRASLEDMRERLGGPGGARSGEGS